MQKKPSFWDSEYFVAEPDNWHLKEGAPKEIVEEFKKYMNKTKMDKTVLKNNN